MNEFPAAVPEIPVTGMNAALDYYERTLGFNIDWGGADGGIAGISKGQCSANERGYSPRTDTEEHGLSIIEQLLSVSVRVSLWPKQ